jgi:cysteine desulfurase/selenocysteine lyase
MTIAAQPEENEKIKKLFNNITSVSQARELFPITKSCIYIDSAHYSQYSLETYRRLNQFIHEFTFTNKNLSLFNFRLSDQLRTICAKLINVDKDETIITTSATHGLNIFVNGIDLQKGDKVAFADSEFPAVVYPWLNQEKLKGIECVFIPSKNGVIKFEDIESTFKNNKIKALTISSVEFLGYRNNIEKIGKLCKETGTLFVVDAIQSMGIIPLDVKKIPEIDFIAAGAQKWLQSPSGIGFAYIPKRNRDLIHPSYVGTTSIKYDFKNFLDYKLNFADDGQAYENSTLNCLGMIGLQSTIELFLKLGVENIFKHITNLLDVFITNIKDSNFKIESNLETEHRSNILIFSHVDGSKNEFVQKELEKKNIFIALREGFLRISPHIFNNEEDILTLCKELKKIDVSSYKGGIKPDESTGL